jgi:hypothetical protein
MKLPNQIKFGLLAAMVIAALAGASFPFRAYVWGPYQARQEAMSLPQLPSKLELQKIGIPAPSTAFNCPDLPVTLQVADLEVRAKSLGSSVQSAPADLCAGNHFRQAIRYLGLHNGQFAIRMSSLPSHLASIAKDPDTIPTEETNSSRIAPDDLEPARLFRLLSSSSTTNTPETQLQLGLSYVDLMIRQGGREHKARLSTRAIEALSAALDRQPYMVAALYARGLNYLYWPMIAGKLPLAIRDLKTCIAISNLPVLKEHPPLVVAEAYRALGDAYVKLSDSSFDRGTQDALRRAGRAWWEEGRRRFQNDRGFDERLDMPVEKLAAYVDSMRGLETYINTDLDLLWTR